MHGIRGAQLATIHHELFIDAPLTRVYDAIATPHGISTWWDKQTARRTDRGLVLQHDPGAEHGIVKLRVVDLILASNRDAWRAVLENLKRVVESAS